MTCADFEPLLARYADDESSIAAGARDELVAHLARCAACRAALDGQRAVAALLRARPAVAPHPGLVARVSARIDGGREPSADAGWLELANWRRWSAALVPLAAALLVAAYIDIAGSASSTTTTATANGAAQTIADWTIAGAPPVVEPSVTSDTLVETVLMGAVPSGETDVR